VFKKFFEGVKLQPPHKIWIFPFLPIFEFFLINALQLIDLTKANWKTGKIFIKGLFLYVVFIKSYCQNWPLNLGFQKLLFLVLYSRKWMRSHLPEFVKGIDLKLA